MQTIQSHRQFLPMLSLAMVLAVSLACSGSAGTPTVERPAAGSPTPEDAGAQSQEVAVQTEDPPSELFLGDAIGKDGYALTVVSVADPATPGILFQPETGMELIAVDLILENISGDPISVNPLNATLIDSEGFSYQPALGGTDRQLGVVDLYPGERVEGPVAFEVPEGALASKLMYLLSPYEIDLLEADLTPPPPQHTAVASGFAPRAAGGYRPRGDSAQQYGYSLSVSSVQDPAQAGAVYSPKEYCRLVGVEIVLRNVSGSAALTANPLFAFLVDQNGFVYTAEIGGMDGQIDNLDLAEGEKAKGWVSFTIPTDAVPAYIKYQTALSTDNYLVAAVP